MRDRNKRSALTPDPLPKSFQQMVRTTVVKACKCRSSDLSTCLDTHQTDHTHLKLNEFMGFRLSWPVQGVGWEVLDF